MDINYTEIYKFFDYIYERQRIWYKKEVLKSEPSWTENSVLRDCSFCNNYRELDKGTKYIIDRVINTDMDFDDKILNIVAYRFFNKYGFFEDILDNNYLSVDKFDFKFYEEILDNKIKEKVGLYNPAYVISQAVINKQYGKRGKHIQILFALQALVEDLKRGFGIGLKAENYPQEAFNRLKSILLVGPFLAYELYCDLSYCKESRYSDNDFVNIGPGAYAGLVILTGKEDISFEDQISLCYYLRDNQSKYLPNGWYDISYKEAYSNAPYLSIRNVEHSLCEWRKFTNITEYMAGGDKCRIRYYYHKK